MHTPVDPRRADGVALVIALMCVVLMMALGVALVLTTSSETIIAGNYRNSRVGFYAAEAAIERAIADLPAVADWDQLLSGALQSSFINGAPSGTRTMANGSTIDPVQVVNMANCRQTAACTAADMDLVTAERPWGANNPRWQLYAYGNLADVVATRTINSQYYVTVLVGDDPSENDGDPVHDGVVPCPSGQSPKVVLPIRTPPTFSCNPGSGVITLRAEAFGPAGCFTGGHHSQQHRGKNRSLGKRD